MRFAKPILFFSLLFLQACGPFNAGQEDESPSFEKPQRDKKAFESQIGEEPFEFVVKGRFVKPRRSSRPVPFVVSFPPLGGSSIIDRGISDELCLNRIATFITKTDLSGVDSRTVPPISDHNAAFARGVAYAKAIYLHALEDSSLDEERFGVLGASMGGIMSSFAMSVFDKIGAGYFVVAGGNLPEILANSTNDKVKRMRKLRIAEHNLKDKFEYQLFMESQLLFDPLDFVDSIDPENVHMVTSRRDTVVPTVNQNELWEAMGQPKRKISRFNHFWTIFDNLTGDNQEKKVAEFFAKKLRSR